MATMRATVSLLSLHLLILILTILHPSPTATAAAATTTADTPYFSKIILSDYKKMLTNFKIFIYPEHPSDLSQTLPPPLSLFFTTLLSSRFVTNDPTQATVFFLPFQPQSTRSLARVIQNTRISYPYWDRSLGADHFYLTCQEMGPSPSRNVVELRKNAVQVSCFPAPAREFVPHKDVTLPPIYASPRAEVVMSDVASTRYLGYIGRDQVPSISGLISELINDPEFLVKSEPSDGDDVEGMKKSKFCLFPYAVEGMRGLGEALVHGCVPVVITDRPIQDFPLMDVIRWSEIALFVGSSVGEDKLKRLLKDTCGEGGEYERMRRLGAAAARHLVWNSTEEEESESYDAFDMVMYQLWLRRHAIRYARWVESASV